MTINKKLAVFLILFLIRLLSEKVYLEIECYHIKHLKYCS